MAKKTVLQPDARGGMMDSYLRLSKEKKTSFVIIVLPDHVTPSGSDSPSSREAVEPAAREKAAPGSRGKARPNPSPVVSLALSRHLICVYAWLSRPTSLRYKDSHQTDLLVGAKDIWIPESRLLDKPIQQNPPARQRGLWPPELPLTDPIRILSRKPAHLLP